MSRVRYTNKSFSSLTFFLYHVNGRFMFKVILSYENKCHRFESDVFKCLYYLPSSYLCAQDNTTC